MGFLMTNMFVGVVCDQYNNVKEILYGSAFLSDDQKDWILIKKMLLEEFPHKSVIEPKNKFRNLCYKIA